MPSQSLDGRLTLLTSLQVLVQMEREGKLHSLTDARKSKTESGLFRSTPNLTRPSSALM